MTNWAFEMPELDRASTCDGTDRLVIAVAKTVPFGIEPGDTVALVARAPDVPSRSEDFPRLIGAGLREGRFVVLLLTLQTGPRETVELTSLRLDPRVPTDLERIEAIMAQGGISVFFFDRDLGAPGHRWVSINNQGVAYFDAFTQAALQTIWAPLGTPLRPSSSRTIAGSAGRRAGVRSVRSVRTLPRSGA